MRGVDRGSGWTRRGLRVAGIAAAAARSRAGWPAEEAMMADREQDGTRRRDAERGRLVVRPAVAEGPAPTGLVPLGLEHGRDGLLYVPAGYRPDRPAPLVVMLHGAGGNARDAVATFRPLAEEAGFLLLAPESRGRTWDVLLGGFGPDVDFIGRSLGRAAGRYAVDDGRVAVAGFSDGASYALSLGLGNGELFGHVLAFAPGFMAPEALRGTPRLILAHGTRDAVLPIDRCSRRLVPQLRRAGYDVTYREFDGPHTVPPAIAAEAIGWSLVRPTPAGPLAPTR